MNIALKREPTADKSRDTHRETSTQFQAVTLDTASPQAAGELAETSVAQREAMTAPRMLSKQQLVLWRDLLTRWAKEQPR